MVARLFFPAFAAHHSQQYHRSLAEILPFAEKAADPEFRMRSTIRHFEALSVAISTDASANFAKGFGTGVAMAKAMDAGIQCFWKSWFDGLAEFSARTSKIFEPSDQAPSAVVFGRSDDGHVLNVRFGSRLLPRSAFADGAQRTTG